MIEHKANLPSKLIMLEGKVFYKQGRKKNPITKNLMMLRYR